MNSPVAPPAPSRALATDRGIFAAGITVRLALAVAAVAVLWAAAAWAVAPHDPEQRTGGAPAVLGGTDARGA